LHDGVPVGVFDVREHVLAQRPLAHGREARPQLLLTATPLQNSLLELSTSPKA
jgi:hypothetical protein